ncbi:MAG: prolyl oligopeptidase family serine peptidase, partial [Cyclobacteriaceae bacterium]
MRSVNLFTVLFCVLNYPVFAQVDTTLIYKPNTEFGTIDIRLSKRAGHSYYLQENNTFSFRKNNEVPTNTYLKMTAWDSSPYTQGNMREKADKQDLFVMNYRLLKPQSYASTLSQGYPLVVVLHGKLERGNCADTVCYHANKEFSPNTNNPPAPSAPDHMLFNNDYNLVHAGLDYLEAHNINGTRLPDDPALPSGAYPGFVLFPQNTNGWDAPASQDVIKLIRLLIKRYNIDPNRIYINGISHGGHGAYEVLKRAPWMFAAAVMFSAADDASLVSQKMAGKISGIPLWIFQGALDANPTQNKTENYIRAFRKAGANVRYTLYPHLGHGTWNEALDEPDFFSWMLGQNRSSIHVDGGNASICPTSDQGRLLILPEGFKSYEWELNGMAIPNAGTNKYLATQPGIYRGRFLMFEYGSEGRWSNWSGNLNVTVQTAASAQTEQIGTLLLRDLNGNPDARLQAVGDYPYYYWYKDGKSLKTQGIPDTLKSVTLRSQLG